MRSALCGPRRSQGWSLSDPPLVAKSSFRGGSRMPSRLISERARPTLPRSSHSRVLLHNTARLPGPACKHVRGEAAGWNAQVKVQHARFLVLRKKRGRNALD